MRPLNDIQADIEFVSNKKDNVFTRLFNSKTDRLNELRNEELKSLNQHLLETNPEYKKLAQTNIQILDGLTWELKVLELTHDKGGITKELSGEITDKGILYCNRIPSFALTSKSISKYVGTIDHLGKIFVSAQDSEFSILHPPKLFLGQIQNGELTLDRKKEGFSVTYDTQIVTMAGDPFQNDNSKRKEFISTRNKLYQIINQNRVKT